MRQVAASERASFDYECAVRTCNIGPFEYRDVGVGVILNDLFQAANTELARNGYDRSVSISMSDFGDDEMNMKFSIQMPRQPIMDAMIMIGERTGLRVKFERGLFIFVRGVGEVL